MVLVHEGGDVSWLADGKIGLATLPLAEGVLAPVLAGAGGAVNGPRDFFQAGFGD